MRGLTMESWRVAMGARLPRAWGPIIVAADPPGPGIPENYVRIDYAAWPVRAETTDRHDHHRTPTPSGRRRTCPHAGPAPASSTSSGALSLAAGLVAFVPSGAARLPRRRHQLVLRARRWSDPRRRHLDRPPPHHPGVRRARGRHRRRRPAPRPRRGRRRDLDALVAAPNGTYSYLASDVGGTRPRVDRRRVRRRGGRHDRDRQSGSFVSGAFRPSNQDELGEQPHLPGRLRERPEHDPLRPRRVHRRSAPGASGWSTTTRRHRWLHRRRLHRPHQRQHPARRRTRQPPHHAGGHRPPDHPPRQRPRRRSVADLLDHLAADPGAHHAGERVQLAVHPAGGLQQRRPAPLLTFTYQVSDGTDAASNTGTIRVTPVNDAPVAADQSVSTAEDTPLAVTLVDSDVDGPSATFTITDDPDHGVLTGPAAPGPTSRRRLRRPRQLHLPGRPTAPAAPTRRRSRSTSPPPTTHRRPTTTATTPPRTPTLVIAAAGRPRR